VLPIGALGAGTGAYITGVGTVIPFGARPFVQSGCYDLPLVSLRGQGRDDQHRAGRRYRGAAGRETVFIVERLMDAARADRHRSARHSQAQLHQAGAIALHQRVGQVYD